MTKLSLLKGETSQDAQQDASWPKIILASNSPRRKELLEGVGLSFVVQSPTIDEKAFADASLAPDAYVSKLAFAKGKSIAMTAPESLVISADTVVVYDGAYLEKPTSREEAAAMLSQIQGTTHTVYTAIGVFYGEQSSLQAKATEVTLAPLTPDEIAAYIATGEPMDKAGSYAIQGLGGSFVASISGCYSNVVGLSLPLLKTMLDELGLNIYLKPHSLV